MNKTNCILLILLFILLIIFIKSCRKYQSFSVSAEKLQRRKGQRDLTKPRSFTVRERVDQIERDIEREKNEMRYGNMSPRLRRKKGKRDLFSNERFKRSDGKRDLKVSKISKSPKTKRTQEMINLEASVDKLSNESIEYNKGIDKIYIVVSTPYEEFDPKLNENQYRKTMNRLLSILNKRINVYLAYDFKDSITKDYALKMFDGVDPDMSLWNLIYYKIHNIPKINEIYYMEYNKFIPDRTLKLLEDNEFDKSINELYYSNQDLLFPVTSAIITRTVWWLSYKLGIYSTVRTALNCLCGSKTQIKCPSKIEFLTIDGGLISHVEKDKMPSIIQEIKMNLRNNSLYGVQDFDYEINNFRSIKDLENYILSKAIPNKTSTNQPSSRIARNRWKKGASLRKMKSR